MKEFLWDWRFVILFILAAIVWLVFNWQKAKIMAYNGMLRAKSLAKDWVLNSGQEQEDWVVERVYPCIPATIRLFMNRDAFRTFVRWLYRIGKDILDDGELNNSRSTALPLK